jgi:uncharacterized protein
MFDLSAYTLRKLDSRVAYKPLDFGTNGLTGSVNQDGRIIAVNAFHPKHGYITLSSIPPFSEDQRYDPAAVRAYRRSIAHAQGFGLSFKVPIIGREVYLVEDAVPFIRLYLQGGVTAECLTFATVDEPVGMMQAWRFSEVGAWAKLTGKLWLQRCAYTQLTEGGVVSMPSIKTHSLRDASGLLQEISNPELDASVIIRTAPLREAEDGSVEFYDDAAATQHFDDETMPHGAASYVFHLGIDNLAVNSRKRYQTIREKSQEDNISASLNRWHRRWQAWEANDPVLEPLIHRALVYGMQCAVPINEEATCIITDHMLLPLSWNRDAYYVAMALMRWNKEAQERVRGHLLWMFDYAERIDGAWGRSYMVHGAVKDKGFQLDQQIFPLLELANYVLYTEDYALLERLEPRIFPVLEMLFSRRRGDDWLFPTDETPADDPIAFPYHFSSHVLLWRTLRRLGRVLRKVGYRVWSEQMRKDIDKFFVTEFEGRKLYAYATDGNGQHHLYHDANDVPLALMPVWGFCSTEDEIWRATVDFAWSAANKGGSYDGHLGSVHTKAPWPLGDAQELMIARVLNDTRRYENTRERLLKAAQWDGALPEAYDAKDFSVVSRHWFAWTNAMLCYIDEEE